MPKTISGKIRRVGFRASKPGRRRDASAPS